MTTELKICTACGEEKPITEFYMVSGKTYRKRSCKACHQARVMAGYWKNLDQRRAKMRDYSRRKRSKQENSDVHS